jgi:hypothetical protein
MACLFTFISVKSNDRQHKSARFRVGYWMELFAEQTAAHMQTFLPKFLTYLIYHFKPLKSTVEIPKITFVFSFYFSKTHRISKIPPLFKMKKAQKRTRYSTPAERNFHLTLRQSYVPAVFIDSCEL